MNKKTYHVQIYLFVLSLQPQAPRLKSHCVVIRTNFHIFVNCIKRITQIKKGYSILYYSIFIVSNINLYEFKIDRV